MPVTIAIPFYNADKYLADAIRSVFAQTYQNWELILIDDGSTDKSLEIAKSIKDPRVRVLSDGKNKKLAARLNEITQLAQYDYIARMDADDLMHPRRIEIQMEILEKNPELDLVSTGVYSMYNNNELIGIRGNDVDFYDFKSLVLKKKNFVHAALIAKKTWYQRNKYDESLPFAQDRDLWLRASLKNDFRALSIKSPLYFYREEGNVTKRKLLKAYSLERNMFIKYHNEYPFSLLFRSYFKSIVVILLDIIGQIKILQSKRSNISLSKEHVNDFNESFELIKKIKLQYKR